MKKIATIIVTYNALKNNWLQNCINSVNNNSYPSTIIIIDNASQDHTVAYIKNNYKEIILIESEKNLGFGKANNLGIEWAIHNKYDYCFLINQDVEIENNTIETLVNASLKQTEFKLISPLHLNGKGDILDGEFYREIGNIKGNKMISDFLLQKNQNSIYPSDFVCAAAWFIPISTFKEIGGFNPTFFHYGEDDNFIQRLQYKNYPIGILPTARIRHNRNRDESWNFGSNEKREKRYLFIELSNPNKNLVVNDFIKHYIILSLKFILRLKFKQIKFNLEQIKFLLKNKKIIQSNKLNSVQEKYAFLKVNL